jgi:hypothetical protein
MHHTTVVDELTVSAVRRGSRNLGQKFSPWWLHAFRMMGRREPGTLAGLESGSGRRSEASKKNGKRGSFHLEQGFIFLKKLFMLELRKKYDRILKYSLKICKILYTSRKTNKHIQLYF